MKMNVNKIEILIVNRTEEQDFNINIGNTMIMNTNIFKVSCKCCYEREAEIREIFQNKINKFSASVGTL